jgi:superfamily II DNA/RNA helicase
MWRHICIVLVRFFHNADLSSASLVVLIISEGRTGRFGRKGVSINFVHDKPTWTKMHFIENALGRPIERISTDDMDEMEKVGLC